MKRILWKALTCILIVMLVSNFTYAAFQSRVYAGVISDIVSGVFGGLIGILTWIPRAILLAIAVGLNSLVTAVAVAGGGSITDDVNSSSYGADDFFVTPLHIFFNKIDLLNVDFFDFDTESDTALIFREAVAGWYYAIRTIASMILLVILIYVGIRMAISTIASEKAMYKKMLVDWTCSLALLFLLHYIMLFTFECNNALVNAMLSMAESSDMTSFMSNLVDIALGIDTMAGFAAIVIYAMLVLQTLSFLITYMKRMITVGFLVMIAPLITITYSIDKMGDNKAQALNTWLKEFVYNVLIQPFHCILFLSFGNIAYQLIADDATYTLNFIDNIKTYFSQDWVNLSKAVLAILCIQFIREGEKIVKKIFGFDKAGSLADMATGTAMAMAAMTQGGKIAKGAGAAAAKGSNALKSIKANPKVQNAMAERAVSKALKMQDKAEGKGKHTQMSRQERKAEAKKTVAEKGAATAAQEAEKSMVESKAQIRADKRRDKQIEKFEQGGPGEQEMAERLKTQREKGHAEVTDDDKAVAKNGLVATRLSNAGQTIGNLKVGEKTVSQRFTAAGDWASNKAKAVSESVPGTMMKEFSSTYGKSIAKGMVGGVMGAAGLAAGSSGMITGYNIGSGLVGGYLENTEKTMSKDMNGYVQQAANASGNMDGQHLAYLAQQMGRNDGFKDIGKELDKLRTALEGLKDKDGNKLGTDKINGIIKDINKDMTHNPGIITEDYISQKMEGAGITDEDEKGKATSAINQYTYMHSMENLYNYEKTRMAAGMEMSDIVGAIKNPEQLNKNNGSKDDTSTGDKPSTGGEPAQQIYREVITVEQKLNMSEITAAIKDVENGNKDAMNTINESAQQILKAVQTNNSDIKTFEEAAKALESAGGHEDSIKVLQAAASIKQNPTSSEVGGGNNK